MNISSIILFIRQMVLTLVILLGMMSPTFGVNGESYHAENPEKRKGDPANHLAFDRRPGR